MRTQTFLQRRKRKRTRKRETNKKNSLIIFSELVAGMSVAKVTIILVDKVCCKTDWAYLPFQPNLLKCN